MTQKSQKSKGGNKKYGRNKRPANQAMRDYVRGKITFEQYQKQINQ